MTTRDVVKPDIVKPGRAQINQLASWLSNPKQGFRALSKSCRFNKIRVLVQNPCCKAAGVRPLLDNHTCSLL